VREIIGRQLAEGRDVSAAVDDAYAALSRATGLHAARQPERNPDDP
jgi:hypothetical protein